MDKNKVDTEVRLKDKEILCSCGSKTYPVARILEFSVMEVSIYCRRCNKLVKQYNRMIQSRQPND